ncbi:MAG TPA: aspartate aminotransferase family protein [Solirubrobacterales bacterium]|nr:aspartate aminotransferase family protein [Solirubrobacterales bacterium]
MELREASRSVDRIHRHAGGGIRRIAEAAGLTIVEGDGSYLIDDRGRRYLDFVSGYGVAALGHRHPHWVEAVTAQANTLSTSPFHNDALGTYLERLAAVLPPVPNRTALFSGGAEAVEASLRLTQLASGRAGVLAFDSAFHGKTAGVRFAGGRCENERRYLGLASWVYSAELGPSLSRCLADRDDLDEIGTVIVEPVLGTAGNIPLREGLLAELRSICDARGWLLVFDESQTGFGRTGWHFAADRFGVTPDVLVMGKAMGGGFPLSGVAAPAELWSAGGLDQPSATSSSYGSNPLACAAGTAVLDVLAAPDFLAGVRNVSGLLAEGLMRLADESPYLSWPRGVGMMLGFDLVDPEGGGPAGPALCSQVFQGCRDRGLLLAADIPRVRLNPPLILSRGEAEQALGIIGEVLT